MKSKFLRNEDKATLKEQKTQANPSIIERYGKTFAYANVLIFVFLSYQYFYYWMNPSMENIEIMRSMFWLFLFEVLAVHSTPFMTMLPRYFMFIIIPFYGLFAYALTDGMGSSYIIITYLILVVNRLRYVFFDVSSNIRWSVAIQSLILTFGYVILLVIVCFSSDLVPRLGFTEEFLNAPYVGEKSGFEQTVAEQCFLPKLVGTHVIFLAAMLYYLFAAYIEYRFAKKNQG